MRDFGDRRSTTWNQDSNAPAAGLAPGKRTLVEIPQPVSAPVQRKAESSAPAPATPSGPRPTALDLFGRVQRKAARAEPDPAVVHASAQRSASSATADALPSDLFGGTQRRASVESAPVQRTPRGVSFLQLGAGPIQQRASDEAAGGETAEIHKAAQRGISTPAMQLPHFDRIQQAFGRHDISGIKAHRVVEGTQDCKPEAVEHGDRLPAAVRAPMEMAFQTDFSSVRLNTSSAEATTLGARAFARGDEVHFAPGEYAPSSGAGREMIGHELAHVVQQRAGRVDAPAQGKGAPIVDDAGLEAEADAAGARAARGEPAGLTGAGPSVARPVTQGYFRIARKSFEPRKVEIPDDTTFFGQQRPEGSRSFLQGGETNFVDRTSKQVRGLCVANTGLMAIENTDGHRQAKTFFIDEGLLKECNDNLAKTDSGYRLVKDGATIKVPAQEEMHELVQVVASDAKTMQQGSKAVGPVNCDQMAEKVCGFQSFHKSPRIKGDDEPMIWQDEEDAYRAAKYLTMVGENPEVKREKVRKAAMYETPKPTKYEKRHLVSFKLMDPGVLNVLSKKRDLGIPQFNLRAGTCVSVHMTKEAWKILETEAEESGGCVEDVKKEKTEKIKIEPTRQDREKALAKPHAKITKLYSVLSEEKRNRAAETLGMNEFSEPGIGDAFVTFGLGDRDDDGNVKDYKKGPMKPRWSQHWGGVVAKSGGDYVTLENYDRKDEDQGLQAPTKETRIFFRMYGSEAKKTWHDKQKDQFPNPISLVFSKPDPHADAAIDGGSWPGKDD